MIRVITLLPTPPALPYDKGDKVDKGREIIVHVNFFDENFISTALKSKQTIFGC